MKIKPTDKVTAIVRVEEYDRFGGGALKKISYTGSYENVLNLISENHSYGTAVGYDEDNDQTNTCEDVLQYIDECNGDGCDFISSLVIKAKGKKIVLIEEAEEEEEVYCD